MTIVTLLFCFPKTQENRAALRTAISAVVAILLAFALHLDKPYWSGMTVLLLANLYTGNILDKAIMRLIGTVAGATLGICLANLVESSLFLYFMMSFFLVAIAVYYYNFSKYAYAYLMLAISAFMVISELAFEPGEAFWVAIWRPIEIGLGVLVSAVAAFSIFPNAIQDNVLKEIHEIFKAMDALLMAVSDVIFEPEGDALSHINANNLSLKKKLRKTMEMIDFMRREMGYSRHGIEQIRLLLDALYQLSRLISFFLAAEKTLTKGALVSDSALTKKMLDCIRTDLITLEKTVFNGDQALEYKPPSVFAEFFAREYLLTLPFAQQKNTLLMAHLLRQINDLLMNLQGAIKQQTTLNKPGMVTHQQQLQSDPDIIIHGMKAGLTVILALSFWLISNWPGGLNGIVSSIVISIRRNLFDMKNIGAHRLIGCLLGGAVFLLSTCFFSLNLYLFIIIIFFSVWGFSWFSFTQVPYAYIGLQANMALVISMAQAGGPATSIDAPLERLAGVIIGIVASLLVANLLWRTDLLGMLQGQLKKIKRLITLNCQRLLQRDKQNALYDLTNIFWVCRGLLESLEKESLNPLNTAQLMKAKAEQEKLVFLQVTLHYIQHAVLQEEAIATAASCQIDLSSLKNRVLALYTDDNPQDAALFDDLENASSQLILAINTPTLSLYALENCVAFVHSLQQLTLLF